MTSNPRSPSSLAACALIAVLAGLAWLLHTSPAAAAVDHRPDLARHFAAAGTTGTMVVRMRDGSKRPRTVVVGGSRSRKRLLPSSTFKIPNALIAIDRGVASGGDHPYPGPNPNFLLDGAPLLPAACEGDLTLATAFAHSCIPVFQRIAREVGLQTYRLAVRRLGYGNRRVDGAPLDAFWLEGPFGISAHEQVAFLERLREHRLPVSGRAQAEVRELLVVERRDGVVLRAKTGYVFTTAPRVGWWVGWLEQGPRTWTFALNLDMRRPEHAAARSQIGRAILADLGAQAR